MNGSFYEIIQQLQYRVLQLEEANRKLSEKVEDIKPLVIENINYKIQELNVDELKGTLNIGLSGEAGTEGLGPFMEEEEDQDEEKESGQNEIDGSSFT